MDHNLDREQALRDRQASVSRMDHVARRLEMGAAITPIDKTPIYTAGKFPRVPCILMDANGWYTQFTRCFPDNFDDAPGQMGVMMRVHMSRLYTSHTANIPLRHELVVNRSRFPM